MAARNTHRILNASSECLSLNGFLLISHPDLTGSKPHLGLTLDETMLRVAAVYTLNFVGGGEVNNTYIYQVFLEAFSLVKPKQTALKHSIKLSSHLCGWSTQRFPTAGAQPHSPKWVEVPVDEAWCL